MNKAHDQHAAPRLPNLILSLIILACVLALRLPRKVDYRFPDSNARCPTEIQWQNLQPGKSDRRDVLKTLGPPDTQGTKYFADGKSFFYYAYRAAGGQIASYAQHRIFFNYDLKVAWMENIVADQDGQYHTLGETTQILGYELDAVYYANNFNPFAEYQVDILSGPDQVFVWSECGVALLVYPYAIKAQDGNVIWGVQMKGTNKALKIRYPEISPVDGLIAHQNSVVFMQILFPPTTFEMFMKSYSYKIPFDLWTDYLRDVYP